ncbi:hypothetical protein M2408_000665 [Sphingobacterium sp. BIGb0165]|nr:hypothetical protein [Sphingobacterium sp. BIGb0165]
MIDKYENWGIDLYFPQGLFFYKMNVEYSDITILLENLIYHTLLDGAPLSPYNLMMRFLN